MSTGRRRTLRRAVGRVRHGASASRRLALATAALAVILVCLAICAAIAAAVRSAVGPDLAPQMGLEPLGAGTLLLFYVLQGVSVAPSDAPGAGLTLIPLGGLALMGVALVATGLLTAGRAADGKGPRVPIPAIALGYGALSYLLSFTVGRPVGGLPVNLEALLLPSCWGFLFIALGQRLEARLRLAGRVARATSTATLLLAAAVLCTYVAGALGAPGVVTWALLFLPNVVLAAVVASFGISVDWTATLVASQHGSLSVSGGTLPTSHGAASVGNLTGLGLAIAATITTAIALTATRKVLVRRRSVPLAILTAGLASFGSVLAAGALVGGSAMADGTLGVRVDVAVSQLFAAGGLWGLLAVFVASVFAHRRGHRSSAKHPAPSVRPGAALLACAGLAIVLLAGPRGGPARSDAAHGPQAVAPDVHTLVGPDSVDPAPTFQPDISPSDEELVASGEQALRDASEDRVALTINPVHGTVSFARVDIPVDDAASTVAVAKDVADRFAPAFGVPEVQLHVAVADVSHDDLGVAHVRFDQEFHGYPVYGTALSIHEDEDTSAVVAISNGLMPDVALPDGDKVSISADQALDRAREALRGATVIDPPRLMVFPGETPQSDGSHSALAWIMRLADENHGVLNVYAIDAQTGDILAVINRAESAKNRVVRNTHHTTDLPGDIARTEGQGATGNEDVDNAYWNAGHVYDYYKNTFGRDSYDNAGATLAATVHYGYNELNAFWNGYRVVYGDGFPVLDVSGHEWTHAVTERTANLDYQLQSGAANESFSDVFGELIERYTRGSADWLVGEDSPVGPLRDMSNPPALHNQPGHLRDYVSTCDDQGGVHINSGILDKAFYLAKQNVGADKAGRIWYRALTQYLFPSAIFVDVRSAAILAAQQLYDSATADGVRQAFNQVGIDGQAQPPTPDCDIFGALQCGVATALSDGTAGLDSDGPDANHILATMYSVRDQLMRESVAGAHYEEVYYDVTGRMSRLLLDDPALREQAAALLQELTPPLESLEAGDGGNVVFTPALATAINDFLDSLSEADKAAGGGTLAATISRERDVADLQSLVGLTFDQVIARLNTEVTNTGGSAG